MKTVFIHIGPPKTGTSTIQKSLYINRARLLENGVFVPEAGCSPHDISAHHNLAWEITKNYHFNEKRGTFEDLLRGIESTPADKVILSSEYFFIFNSEQIQTLRKFLENYKIFIITYLRRQDLMMQSIWSQRIKTELLENFSPDFYPWLNKNNYFLIRGDYPATLENWSVPFGKENLHVRVLEKNQLKGALFHDFLSTCGLENSSEYENAEDANIAPGIKTLVLIQQMKKSLAGTMNEKTRRKLYDLVQSYGNRHGWDKQKVNLIDQETHDKIMGHYREGNKKVAREYFGRDELFLEPFHEKDLTRFSVEDFESEEILEAFTYVMKDFFPSENIKSENANFYSHDHVVIKEELDSIYASRGWKLLQKMRALWKKLGLSSR